jgi:hypothetical protein
MRDSARYRDRDETTTAAALSLIGLIVPHAPAQAAGMNPFDAGAWARLMINQAILARKPR